MQTTINRIYHYYNVHDFRHLGRYRMNEWNLYLERHAVERFLLIHGNFEQRLSTFIISMTKLLGGDWLRGVQLFH
jgi:hypothetical protein